MGSNYRIDEFLKLQDKGLSLDEISLELKVKPSTLRRELNKNGYKSKKGKYVKALNDIESINQNSIQVEFENTSNVSKNKIKTNNEKKKVKKDKKINITQDDLDKLCEVYDWYLQVKDLKSLKPKKLKKEIVVDYEASEDKNINLKVDKKVWEEFLRLCSNSGFDRKTLVTQALNDFMKIYKDLL